MQWKTRLKNRIALLLRSSIVDMKKTQHINIECNTIVRRVRFYALMNDPISGCIPLTLLFGTWRVLQGKKSVLRKELCVEVNNRFFIPSLLNCKHNLPNPSILIDSIPSTSCLFTFIFLKSGIIC